MTGRDNRILISILIRGVKDMAKRATDPPAQSESTGQGTLPKRSFRLWSLLACAAVALAVAGGATSTPARHGETPGGEGYYRPPTCPVDYTIDCDDRFDPAADAGIVSCHMRNPQGGDEGFAVKACNDVRLASEAFLENDVTIHATSFGQITCGHEAETDKDFCLVCQTFTTTSGGRRNCVKIVHDDPQQPTLPGPCGTFNVINDDLSDSMCSGETEELGQTFSDPHLGFFIEIKTMNAGEEAGGDG